MTGQKRGVMVSFTRCEFSHQGLTETTEYVLKAYISAASHVDDKAWRTGKFIG